MQNEGLRGMYKGIVPSLILTSTNCIQFMIYEELKRKFNPKVELMLVLEWF